jgi:hypothetical protein
MHDEKKSYAKNPTKISKFIIHCIVCEAMLTKYQKHNAEQEKKLISNMKHQMQEHGFRSSHEPERQL